MRFSSRVAGVARPAEHADHDAAVVAAPDRAIRRQRIGAVALVAVDGRRGEHGGGAGVLQQSGEIGAPERAQRLAAILGHERILAARARHDRLMQVPAGREHVRQFRPAHEGRVIAVAAGDLLHGRTKQHHVVGGRQPLGRRKSEFALARAELDLDRSQGQAERQHVAPDDFQRRLHLVVALLGQILIAVRQQADRWRRAGLAGILRRHVRVFELEEVEFDFQPRDEIVAALVRA